MAKHQDTPLLDQLGGDDDEDSDDGLDFDPVKMRLRIPKSLYARSVKKSVCVGLGFVIVVIVLVTLVVAVGLLISSRSPNFAITGQVYQSPFDTREYTAIQLNNNLRVLLISDPTTDLSAAAMDVSVGSFSDTVPGLAHFCEHMLFYGSKKYPKEDEYSEFLTQHGGYDNAYTSTENTNYFFRVNSDSLHEALDRFAQFFIAPILAQDGVNREMNAINAEHLKNLQSDNWRQWQLLKSVSNPDHPFHNFNTGDLQTLNRSDILSKLKAFYSTHYSANQMQLVIYGKEDSSTLMDYAVSIFSPIVNNNIERNFISDTAFPPPGKIVYYVPVASKHSLSIYWQVDPQSDHYREQVIPFITSLLGGESSGSILNNLKLSGWATALSAGPEIQTESFDLVYVDVTLTQNGLHRVSDVIQVVMQYVNLLKSLGDNDMKNLWKDYVEVANLTFNYAAKTQPSDYASSIAARMRTVELAEDYLLSPRRFVYSFSNITNLLNDLNPAEPVIMLGSPEFNTSFTDSSSVPLPPTTSPVSQIEPIYGTKYKIVKISNDSVKYWNETDKTSKLSVPSKNQFIPHSLSLIPADPSSTAGPVSLSEAPPASSVWWQTDVSFKEPRAHVYCSVSAGVDSSQFNASWTAIAGLYSQMVKNLLIPDIYQAILTGYSFDITPTSSGVQLHLTGLSDTDIMTNLMSIITGVLTNRAKLQDMVMFSLSLEAFNSSLETYNTTSLPFRYVYQYIQQVVMERPYWKHWQVAEALKSVDNSKLLKYVDTLYGKSSNVICFNYGNIARSTALSLSTKVSQLLSSQETEIPNSQFTRRRMRLSPGNYSLILPALDPNDQNSVVNVVYQIGVECNVSSGKCSKESLTRSALLGLLALQIKQSCFDVLRTQQQLGYAVFCRTLTYDNVNSFQVIVQSGTYSASTVLNRIDSFFQNSLSAIQSLASDGGMLAELKDSYKIVLERKDLSLSDAASRIWKEISTGRIQFDFTLQVAQVVNSISGVEILDFYKQNMLNFTTAKKLVIATYGKGQSSELDVQFQNSINYTTLQPTDQQYPRGTN